MSAQEFELNNEDFKKRWVHCSKVDGSILENLQRRIQRWHRRILYKRANTFFRENECSTNARGTCLKILNQFSTPSETEIKQEIGAQFASSKDSKRQKRNKKDNTAFVDMSKAAIDWEDILDEVVVTNRAEKPEIIYELFVSLMTNTHPFAHPVFLVKKKTSGRSTIYSIFTVGFKRMYIYMV